MNAPHLQFGFYFSKRSGDDALEMTFRHLLSQGAKCKGWVQFDRGDRIKAKPLCYGDYPSDRPIEFADSTQVEALLADPNTRIHFIEMRPPEYFGSCRELRLGQTSINETSTKKDRNPIAIWQDGSILDGPEDSMSQKARKLVREALSAFKQLIASLEPDYASITVESWLPCPSDLRKNPNTYAFYNFYVSEKLLGQEALESIRLKLPKAVHEQLPGGQLTLTSWWLHSSSPRKRRIPLEDVRALCDYVASLIARKAKPL